ncbi:PadR family transcriptional regulator [Sphingomonas sp. Leaf33]|uniref:PadR family transcriptional regulator n=1 Tax=Sphingomonas sp. Leaf33 TaxID=1736215 RepID=UPI0006F22AA8|nr:PadR family transcriptional regulator [Sphingomonas sp. Leaf33]KQN26564.1 PadR family transcriptional regulator [Sphingomonas sp. Leaf33]
MFGPHHAHRHGGPGRGHRGGWEQFAADWAERADRPGRGGGGRMRMFSGDELRLVLLKLIAEAPRHGYDLIREIEARTGGGYAPSPGVVYPTLTMLADMDLIAEQPGEGAKKVFAVTAAGEAHLEERAGEVAALFERLAAVGAERSRSDRAPIRRAMRNLRAVLQERLGAGDLSDEDAHRVAAILDEAVQRIERL